MSSKIPLRLVSARTRTTLTRIPTPTPTPLARTTSAATAGAAAAAAASITNPPLCSNVLINPVRQFQHTTALPPRPATSTSTSTWLLSSPFHRSRREISTTPLRRQRRVEQSSSSSSSNNTVDQGGAAPITSTSDPNQMSSSSSSSSSTSSSGDSSKSSSPHITSYTFEDVQNFIENPKPERIIIDVREPSELASTGRIPTAINLPINSSPDFAFLPAEEFEDKFHVPRPDEGKEVIFYCKKGVRSRAAARFAQDAGFGGKVGNFEGSWVEWEERGGTVQRD